MVPYSRKFWWEKNFGELQAKLHLVKKTLADLSPSFFRYYKQLVDKTLANS